MYDEFDEDDEDEDDDVILGTSEAISNLGKKLAAIEKAIKKTKPLSFADQCAIAAMQSFLANPNSSTGEMTSFEYARTTAGMAYVFANAMDAERRKRNKETS